MGTRVQPHPRTPGRRVGDEGIDFAVPYGLVMELPLDSWLGRGTTPRPELRWLRCRVVMDLLQSDQDQFDHPIRIPGGEQFEVLILGQ